MNTKAFASALAIYSLLPGLVVVSAIYFLTHSGLYMVGVMLGGMLLMLIGGASGRGTMSVGAGQFGEKDSGVTDLMVESIQLDSPIGSFRARQIREVMIYFGFGLMAEGFIALVYFRGGLQ